MDPDKKAGSLNLKIGKKALFRVRLKDEGFKVLEQNIFEEEFLEMDDENEPSKGLPNANEEDFEGSSDPEELGMLDDTPAGVEEEKHELASVLDKVEDIPLHISVELTHFKMTCEKLMQLKPGNLLELNLKPEKPVDLIANGKKIAQGELIRVGEVLGVRILNIG
ncbi:MAG: hypothetical protein S4CHLAM7_04830 [Chlamydiae bacterium]|nr:hypothetical protein [Chlamydiota bacterium]